MNTYFVPKKESLELQKLGFDEPCFAFYNGKFLDYKIKGGDICPPYLSTENIGKCTNAPLYQQVFRWFREKHNIHISIGHSVNGKFDCCTNDVTFTNENGEYCEFETYEEAELACLKKMIKIIKQNNRK